MVTLDPPLPPSAAAALGRGGNHIGLGPYCGICGGSMKMDLGDKYVLLLGNIDSTGFSYRSGPHTFLGYGHGVRGDPGTFLLCQTPGCSRCAFSCEASAVHADCFAFVAQPCSLDDCGNDRLWIVTAWRAPWRQAPQFHLQDAAVAPDVSMLQELGISRMRLLPPELLQMIHAYSTDSLFWRLNAASDLARRLPPASPDQLLSVPLCTVGMWNRGSQPVLETFRHLPVVRVTIDSWGIQCVERLPGHPSFERWRSDRFLFIVLDSSRLQGVTALFRFGLIRLVLPPARDGLETWNTPTPPQLKQCFFYLANIGPSTQFRMIDLRQTTGITFFLSYGRIYAIHAHTRRAPCAQSTYQHLSRRRKQKVIWVYLPISQDDSITALGARISLSETSRSGDSYLVFRMKLAGDITVGLSSSLEEARDIPLSRFPPLALIHNSTEVRPVSVFGAYFTEDHHHALPLPRFNHPVVGDAPFSHPQSVSFSSAPLDKVRRIGIFNRQGVDFCVGILLEYNNGAQRALGQCRVGVDAATYNSNPACICFLEVGMGAVVESADSCDHTHAVSGWRCLNMRGQLGLWTSCEETKVTVVEDT